MITNIVKQFVHGYSIRLTNNHIVSHRLDGAGVHYRDYAAIYYLKGRQMITGKKSRLIKNANKYSIFVKDII